MNEIFRAETVLRPVPACGRASLPPILPVAVVGGNHSAAISLPSGLYVTPTEQSWMNALS